MTICGIRRRSRVALTVAAMAAMGAPACSPEDPRQTLPVRAAEITARLPSPLAEDAAPRFVLHASSTGRLALLEQLAESEGFRIGGPMGGLGVTTASIEANTVEAVLAALLHDVPFSLHYRPRGSGALVRLAEVELWPSEASSRSEVAASREGRESSLEFSERSHRADVELAHRVGRRLPLTAQEVREEFDLRRGQEERARETALLDLESEEVEVRHAALSFLDVERADDARRLAHLAIDDPDPGVRLEAVEQLSFGDPAVAIPILREAMLDSDEPVAITAKNELEHALGQLSQD